MTHLNQNDFTTQQFSVRAAGARLWLLELAGFTKSVFLPQGLLDYRDLSSAPSSPPLGRVREYWLDGVKQYRNSSGKVVRQLGFDQTGLIPIDIIGKGTGATKTTTRIDGRTIAEQFTIGDEVFAHVILPGRLDPAEDATIFMAWYPVGSQVGKLISWEVEVARMASGTLVDKAADVVLTTTDAASPATAFTNTSSAMTLPSAHLVEGEPLHIQIRRVASSNDPSAGAAPAIHHAGLLYTVR